MKKASTVAMRALLFPVLLLVCAGCAPLGGSDASPDFQNLTDLTNSGAHFVGASACRQCHTAQASLHAMHGHAHALNQVSGAAPDIPPGPPASVEPPAGFEWNDISYVVGGYVKKALFLDAMGFLITTGRTGVPTRWHLAFPATDTTAGFSEFFPDDTAQRPFDFDLIQRYTTGPMRQTPEAPSQQGRPGIEGTWHEDGVQCEACHGPGSNHFATAGRQVQIRRDRIFVDPDSVQTCMRCHNTPFADATGEIAARDGFIVEFEQGAELRASGGHAQFSCTICHDPHRSLRYDRANAIRNDCNACHADMNMAGHGGATFTRGDYEEPLTCHSCHLPFAAKAASMGTADVFGADARVGDTRSHIFRIETQPLSSDHFFSPDGSRVQMDAEGRAGLTVDFVCLRCHNANGVFELSVDRAAEIAPFVHQFQ